MPKARIFSIVIPCFNEALAIPIFLTELSEFINKMALDFSDTELHVTFVNNNSSDSSKKLLEDYCEGNSCLHLINEPIQGYGSALKTGFQSLQADYYGFLDLDNTYPLNNFITGYRQMLSMDSKMLMTNRFSVTSGMPILRSVGNQFFAKLVNILFSVNRGDVCSGQRILSDSIIGDVLKLSENGLSFSIQLTCLALKNKWSITDLPIQYNIRTGESKLSVIKDGLIFLKVVLQTKFF